MADGGDVCNVAVANRRIANDGRGVIYDEEKSGRVSQYNGVANVNANVLHDMRRDNGCCLKFIITMERISVTVSICYM